MVMFYIQQKKKKIKSIIIWFSKFNKTLVYSNIQGCYVVDIWRQNFRVDIPMIISRL